MPQPPNDSVPPPDEDWLNQKDWVGDPAAARENEAQGYLDQIDKVKTGAKIRAIRHSGFLVVALMYFGAILMMSTVSIWFWHYLAPERWCWMTEEHLRQIQTIVFSGSFAAVISIVAQQYIGLDARNLRDLDR